MGSRVADYELSIAFEDTVQGLFYVDSSALDGPDGLYDGNAFQFQGDFDTVPTDDVVDAVTVIAGTDTLGGTVQASSLECDLMRPDDPSYWNPNNQGEVGNEFVNPRLGNPTPLYGWRQYGGGAGSVDNAWAQVVPSVAAPHDAGHAAQYDVTAGAGKNPQILAAQYGGPWGSAASITVVPGDEVTGHLSGRVKQIVAGGVVNARLVVNYRKADGSYITSRTLQEVIPPITGTWYTFHGTDALGAPALAAYADISWLVTVAAAGDRIVIEATEALISVDLDPGEYVDGGQAGMKWSGAADASSSIHGAPLNSVTPGFVPMRPVKLISTQDATPRGIFWGFIRRAVWSSSTYACSLYCEDLLLWGSRIYPEITSTGPTTTGGAIGKVLDAMGWTDPAYRDLDVGDAIDDFSADGSRSALQLIAALIEAERGAVYVNGDGVVVYENRSRVRTRAASAALADALVNVQSGIDVDKISTRTSVTRTGGTTATAIDTAAERQYGRGDMVAIDSPYIPTGNEQALADDLLYEAVNGQPPVTVDVDNDTDTTLTVQLATQLRDVLDLKDELGGTLGDHIVRRVEHTIKGAVSYHHTRYLMTPRPTLEFTLESALDGPHVLRY